MLIYLFFAVLALFFFWPFLTGRNILSFRDLSLYFYPLRLLMVNIVKSGQLPLWNPYLFCGHPLFATLQIGALYPLSLIYYLLPFNLAFNYYTIVHYFLAALFMYWLMRYFSCSRPASFLAAIVFAFSGYLLSMANMNTTLSSVIWLPLLLLVYDRYLKASSRDWSLILLLGLLFSVQYLGGEPTVLYISFVFLLLYGLVESRKTKQDLYRNLGGLLLSLAMAGALCAVQILPFLEASKLSMRTVRTDFSFIAHKSFPPRELINFILPNFFGNLVREGTYTRMLAGDKHQVWLLSPYLGFFPVFFAFLTLLRRNRRVIFLWSMVVFSLFLAFGRFTPVYSLFFHFLPGIALIRYPVKFIFLAVFCLSLLCGLGFNNVQTWLKKSRWQVKKALAPLLFMFLIVAVIYLLAKANTYSIFIFLRSQYPADLDTYFVGILWKLIVAGLNSWGDLLLTIFFGLAFFYLALKRYFRLPVFNCLIIALVLINLAVANIGINPAGDHQIFDRSTPNLAIMQKDLGVFRYFAIPPRGKEASIVFNLFNENLYHIKDNLTPDFIVPYKIPCLGGRESMEPRDFLNLSWYYIRERAGNYHQLLDLANVKYVFALKYMNDPAFKVLRVKKVGDIKGYLYRNLSYLPRAYFVRSVKTLKNREGIVELIGDQGFDPRREAILEEHLDYEWRPAKNDEMVLVKRSDPNSVRIVTLSDEPRLLFLSETYYPGWKAYVDRKETKIYRANYMFRAVLLPPGEHKVDFVYDPASFKFGALISGLTLLGLAVIVLMKRFSTNI